MITIAETTEFIQKAKSLLSEEERQALLIYLSRNPTDGAIIEGTGGVRKLRWALQGIGKSGGARIIYFYHNERMPLYVLTIYRKGAKDNLSKAERNELAKLVDHLVSYWRN